MSEAKQERDPRVGDVYRRGMSDRSEETRHITAVRNNEIVEFHSTRHYNRKASVRADAWAYIGFFRRWSKQATLIKRGDV